LRPDYQEAVAVLAKAQERLKVAKNTAPPPAAPVQAAAPAQAASPPGLEPQPAPAAEPQPAPAQQPAPVPAKPIALPAPPAPAVTAQQHETRGRALTQSGKYPEALAELAQAIQLKPELATAYNARGYVYLLTRDYPHALADFNDAIRLKPAYANAYQNRSIARKALGDAAGAAADLKAAH
jgi:tetratricopeptide (TPR) repeat protein